MGAWVSKHMKRKDWVYIGVIVLFLALFFHPFLTLTQTRHGGDFRNNDVPVYILIKQIVIDNINLPSWNPYLMGGEPHLLVLGFPFLYLPAILLGLIVNPYAVVNLLVIFHIFFAGIGMFFLARKLTKNSEAAFLSAMTFSLAFFLVRSINHPFWVYGIAFIPLEFLLAFKAVNEQRKLLWSTLLGIIFALHFLSGGVFQWYFSVFFIGFYLFYSCCNKNWKDMGKKVFFVGGIWILIMFLLIGVRFIPFNTWVESTNRGLGLSQEEVYGTGHVSLENAMDTFVVSFGSEGKYSERRYGQIGIVGLILALFGLAFLRKGSEHRKTVLFLFMTMVLVIFFAAGLFLSLTYSIPGMDSMRGLDRALIIYVACASILVGFGYLFLKEKFSGKWLFYVVALLLVGNLVILDYPSVVLRTSDFEPYEIVENNPVFLRISEDAQISRFHVNEIRGIDYNNFMGSTIPRGLSSLYGMLSPVWDFRYFNQFLGVSFQNKPAIWGAFNVKYVISATELNESRYELVEVFEGISGDEISKDAYVSSAYLYRNTLAVPRAYKPEKIVLSVGQGAKDNAYALMVSQNFNPQSTAILELESLSQIDSRWAGEIDIVLLSQGYDAGTSVRTRTILESLRNSGAEIYPDVLSQEASINPELLFAALLGESNFAEIEIIQFYDENTNQLTLDVSSTSGLVFAAEKFSMYEGWTAEVDGVQTEIFSYNGIMSAVYVPEDTKELKFKYSPPGQLLGIMLSIFGLVLAGCFIVFDIKRHRAGKKL